MYCRQLWLLNHDLVNFQFKIFSQSFLFTGLSSDGHINKFLQRIFFVSSYRRLPGCVVMGINRTRRLFGRQKKDAWAASQYTLYEMSCF